MKKVGLKYGAISLLFLFLLALVVDRADAPRHRPGDPIQVDRFQISVRRASLEGFTIDGVALGETASEIHELMGESKLDQKRSLSYLGSLRYFQTDLGEIHLSGNRFVHSVEGLTLQSDSDTIAKKGDLRRDLLTTLGQPELTYVKAEKLCDAYLPEGIYLGYHGDTLQRVWARECVWGDLCYDDCCIPEFDYGVDPNVLKPSE